MADDDEGQAQAQGQARADAQPQSPPAAAPAPAQAPPDGAAPETQPRANDPRDERIATLEAREKELLDRLARLQADFENFRRRAREEAAQARGQGKLDLVRTLIPVLDNLDRALAHSQDEGLQLLAKQVRSTLTDAGLVLLDPAGEAFDAKVHEAIAQEAREGAKPGTIVAVLEKGYLFDGKLVRPARVVVAP